MTTPRHASMDQFLHREDCLLVNGVPITRLAARVGQTPFYAYDRRVIDMQIGSLRNVLPRSVRLHYAMKANPMPALVSYMASRVDGVDVASAAELRVALNAGVNSADISFAGPGKGESELVQAIASGILINVESAREVELLGVHSRRLALPARIAVRVNPDFELKTSGMKMSGGPKQFGVDAESIPDLLKSIESSGLDFQGFHIYAGSQNLDAGSICEAQKKSYELALQLSRHAPRAVRELNLGGGFGIPYFPGDNRLDIRRIGENLAALQARAEKELPDARITIELGRYLVGEAGIYVCRVVDRKVSRGHVFLVTDGGLHHHLAASGNFGQVIRKNYPVAIGNRMRAVEHESVTVVGPLCTPLDLLGERLQLPVANAGDLVVVFQSGAYGATASPQQFLGHPAPIEVLV